ncbi:hypothetical protein TNCV_1858651 [Trichonephila clavipes]|nr:hypothetical protein TNCV_1858651 [Trichonephila clavipes]
MEPSKTAQRNSRGAEEQRNRQYPAEQHQEKEPQHGSLRRRSGVSTIVLLKNGSWEPLHEWQHMWLQDVMDIMLGCHDATAQY